MKTALITGASGGIGYELAKLFARDGYELILVARDHGRLNEASEALSREFHVPTTVHAIDLSSPSSAQFLSDAVARSGKAVDVLVNNAGFGLFGAFKDTKLERELSMIQLNITSLTELTKLFLPAMLARGSGRILNVASTAAFQPGPLMAVYYASKAYVLSFSEALAEELSGTGVTVTTLCPGPTETGFQRLAQMEGSKLFRRGVASSAQVAAQGYRAMNAGRRLTIAGLANRLMAFSIRFLPRRWAPWFVLKAQEKQGGK
jgi:short-subunit dehydrogenase